MADYAFRSHGERQKIQELVEAGMGAKEISAALDLSLSSVYVELRRGRDGTRLPDMRLAYKADLAQLRVQQSLERRGHRTAGPGRTVSDSAKSDPPLRRETASERRT